MSWDIYGNPLRRGYCEVHPDVHQEYPCSICMAQKQQQSQPHNELEQLQYEFAQQGDYIRHLESERAALSTQVESLLDDRKAFVKKEFELLKEIERLEIELKKRDEQNAALAAQVAELSRFISVYEELQKLTPPKQNLAEIRAEAIEQAATYLSESMPDKSHESVIFKDGYVYISTRYLREHAETIRQGGAA